MARTALSRSWLLVTKGRILSHMVIYSRSLQSSRHLALVCVSWCHLPSELRSLGPVELKSVASLFRTKVLAGATLA